MRTGTGTGTGTGKGTGKGTGTGTGTGIGTGTVNLVPGKQELPAHRLILCASSEVFQVKY